MTGNLLTEFGHELVITVILSVGGTMIMWPFRKAKKIFEDVKTSLDQVHTELVTQRSNCLSTLQSQGESQIKVLEKMSDTLSDMHSSQLEMSGYLKGMNRN